MRRLTLTERFIDESINPPPGTNYDRDLWRAAHFSANRTMGTMAPLTRAAVNSAQTAVLAGGARVLSTKFGRRVLGIAADHGINDGDIQDIAREGRSGIIRLVGKGALKTHEKLQLKAYQQLQQGRTVQPGIFSKLLGKVGKAVGGEKYQGKIAKAISGGEPRGQLQNLIPPVIPAPRQMLPAAPRGLLTPGGSFSSRGDDVGGMIA